MLQHELTHSGSAQSTNNTCGLAVDNNVGVEVNEGMTEFLTQDAIGMPGFKKLEDGNTMTTELLFYPIPTFVIYSLSKRRSYEFATLYNAYYGQVDNPAALKGALQNFYDLSAIVQERKVRRS